MIDITNLTYDVKSYALELGFDLVGIASPNEIEEFKYFRDILDKGYLSKMEYLANYQDKRQYPELLFEGTKSIISLALNYNADFPQDNFKIAKYALGDDYHFFMKDKINELFEYIKLLVPEAEAKVCVDTAPVMEKTLAKRAGIGWIGKNTLLINPNKGSYFYLGELFLNIELKTDSMIKDHCGSCNRCMEACPTDAIVEPYILDASKCISYHTIESKEENIDNSIDTANNLFGCDICQVVCPWNKKFSTYSDLPEVQPRSFLKNIKDIMKDLTQEKFSELFRKSAVKRAKFKGLKRNYDYLMNNSTNTSNKKF